MPEINAVLHTAKSVAVGHPGDFGIQHETFRAPKQTRCFINVNNQNIVMFYFMSQS